jgi:hypothetical protein
MQNRGWHCGEKYLKILKKVLAFSVAVLYTKTRATERQVK